MNESHENKKNSILYITHDYMTFTKDQIETMSSNFDNVYVIVRYNKLTDLSAIIPIKKLKYHSREKIIDDSEIPPNVKIFPSSSEKNFIISSCLESSAARQQTYFILIFDVRAPPGIGILISGGSDGDETQNSSFGICMH